MNTQSESKPKYTIVVDFGKPDTKQAKDETELRAILKQAYEDSKQTDYQVDVIVYDDKDNDISETQAIDEMMAEIINEDNIPAEKDYELVKQRVG